MKLEKISQLMTQQAIQTDSYSAVFEKFEKAAAEDERGAIYKTKFSGKFHNNVTEDNKQSDDQLKTEENISDRKIYMRFAGDRDYKTTGHNKYITLKESNFAKAQTFLPIRDIILEAFIIEWEDKKLDIIGPPYPGFWTIESGNAPQWMHNVAWADKNGIFGFDHNVKGTVTGMQSNRASGIYIRFIPPITPGIAQIRPYLPFSYRWSTLSFKSREDSSGTFGVRVWSWSLNGGDMTLEQDYQYSCWKKTSIASYFSVDSNPSWYDIPEDNIPGLDFDNAFNYGTQPPYFQTRPDRIYMASISCFGLCWSVSPENRPGISIGRIDAKMPWVVVGYQ